MFRLRRSVKWGPCRCMLLSHFAACRGALHGNRGCHLVGPIPAGNHCAPAGGTHHPDLSSVHFLESALVPFCRWSRAGSFDCQCWIREIERGWQRAGGTCSGFVALLKWPLWRSSHHRGFAACRGVLTLQLEAHEVSGAIPAGSRAAPAGETCPPDLSSVRFLRVRPSSILQMEWGGLFFSSPQVPCLVCRLSGIRTRLQNVTEGGGMYFACRSESDSPQG